MSPGHGPIRGSVAILFHLVGRRPQGLGATQVGDVHGLGFDWLRRHTWVSQVASIRRPNRTLDLPLVQPAHCCSVPVPTSAPLRRARVRPLGRRGSRRRSMCPLASSVWSSAGCRRPTSSVSASLCSGTRFGGTSPGMISNLGCRRGHADWPPRRWPGDSAARPHPHGEVRVLVRSGQGASQYRTMTYRVSPAAVPTARELPHDHRG